MKNLLILLTIILTLGCSSPAKDPGQGGNIEQADQVKSVMMKYKETLESLDVSESYALFTDDSQVLEQGKIEGTYKDYIANHIGPGIGSFFFFQI